jgi:UDP-N-acetylglucosamine 2-epimerase (non-hydrolysing)
MKILNIVGARPNFMKIAPLMEQMRRSSRIDALLLHTGQHYDEKMNQVFFDQLKIPAPDFHLEVGSGSPSWQVGEIAKRFEPVLLAQKPDAILVVGDVSSTVATALVASYHRVPVFHVEAGLRSFDLSMPEEINRMLTDRLSSLLFTTEKSAAGNLEKEGVAPGKIYFVGNMMVDTLLKHKEVAERDSAILQAHGLKPETYCVLTLHRPSNVDSLYPLKSILEAVAEIHKEMRVVFPIHPRTLKNIREFGYGDLIEGFVCLEPIPYLDMLKLMMCAGMVFTDSGGIQEETTVLGVPCLTLRENTERPVTVSQGTNYLVGVEKGNILAQAQEVLRNGGKRGRVPELWDGQAAVRATQIIENWTPGS